MHVIAERKLLQKISRNLNRIVPATSPISDLTGILMEADENAGLLHLTANNLEICIRYSIPASVHLGGRMVLNSALLTGMMPLLAGETVELECRNSGLVNIRSGSAEYHLSCLSGEHYPQPEIPPMKTMTQLSGLDMLMKRTAFAAQKPGKDAGALANIKLDIHPTELHMTGSNISRLATARHVQTAPGTMTLLIPSNSLSILAGIAENEVVQAGQSGNTLVFQGKNFVVTSRTIPGAYPDMGSVLQSIRPEYDALVPAKDLWQDADRLSVVAESSSIVKLALLDNGIHLDFAGENSRSQTVTQALVYRPTPAAGFHYSVSYLLQALRYMEGNIRLYIDKNGILLLKGVDQCYLFTPMRPRKPVVKATPKKKSTKQKKNENKDTAKAA